MDDGFVDALTRRASVVTLGAAGLAGLARPVTADAKKNKRKKGDANKRCKQQAGDWTILVNAEFEDDPVYLQALACADPLRSCDFGSFLDCIFDT